MPEVKVVNAVEPRTCSKCKKIVKDEPIIKKRVYDVKRDAKGKVVSKTFSGTMYICRNCYKDRGDK